MASAPESSPPVITAVPIANPVSFEASSVIYPAISVVFLSTASWLAVHIPSIYCSLMEPSRLYSGLKLARPKKLSIV